MFKCVGCHNPIGPGISAIRVILEEREKKYPFRPHANRPVLDPETGKYFSPDDAGGVGHESVREGQACAECAPKYKQR